MEILLLPHTHWDREWYHPLARFRLRLAALVDAVLDRADEERLSFLLDGQAVVLRDYLLLRPEREPEVRGALAGRRLEAGPWFVLADNLIPSGEAIVRNLEAGRRALRRLGADAPPVAYCPDSFGHPAMLPAIAAGFGLGVAVAWRGFGGSMHPPVNVVQWHAPDGSSIVLHHLPPDGYEFGSALPADESAARARWQRIVGTLAGRSNVGVALLPNGADHHALQPDLMAALQIARGLAGSAATVEPVSLRAFAGRLLERTAGGDLPSVHGELRDSYGYTWTLQGTFGTRPHLKRANARLERALLRDVEPWVSLAVLRRGTSDHRASGVITPSLLPTLLHHAWETLLEAHPHDTLCGCSIDDVARDMAAGQRSVAAMLPELRGAALASALGHDPVIARGPVHSAAAHGTTPLVMRNRAARDREGVVELEVRHTIADVAVGPGSAAHGALTDPGAPSEPHFAAFARLLPGWTLQSMGERLRFHRRESPQHYPDNDAVMAIRVLAWAPAVPALGLRVFTAGSAAGPGPRCPVVVEQDGDGIRVGNDQVVVSASRRGVIVRRAGVERTLSLTSTDDAGDSYTASPRGAPHELRVRRVRAGARGPLRGSVIVDWSYRRLGGSAPPELARFAADGTSKAAARRVRGTVHVRTEISLDAGSSLVVCAARTRNALDDHRLQLWWRAPASNTAHGSRTWSAWADAAFGPVRREAVAAPAGAAETPPDTMPLHRWVAATAGTETACVLSDGLAEACVRDGHIGITLLRATGELSRADLPERPGHAGWPARIPRAQCHGLLRARIALLLEGRGWSDDVVSALEVHCDDFLLPLVGESWPDLTSAAREGEAVRGVALDGDGLALSAVIPAEDGGVTLRCVNLLDREVPGAWTLPDGGPWEVTRCRLDGTPLSAPATAGERVTFSVRPRAIETMSVRRVAR